MFIRALSTTIQSNLATISQTLLVSRFYICQRVFPLSQAITFFEQKSEGIQYSRVHLLKSLVYFADAEADEMPQMLESASWEVIKQFFESQTRKLYGGKLT